MEAILACKILRHEDQEHMEALEPWRVQQLNALVKLEDAMTTF